MKKIRIFTSLKVLLLSGGIVLSFSGCNNHSIDSDTSVYSNEEDNSVDNFSDDNQVVDNSGALDNTEESSFDYFSSDLLEIEELIDEHQLDAVKDKAKDIFVTGVDFIFYDGEISGVTFNELTDQGKEVTIDNLESLGEMVDSVIPGWREELSEKYQVASDFVSSVYLSGLERIREYLGDENYEALGEIKDQILGDITDTYDGAKERVKSWYEEFRSR